MGSQFSKLAKCKVGSVNVTKYESDETGIQVVIAKTEGPLVKAYISVATEALSNDGAPHTLEHIVFLGSKNWPYKGVLDRLAARCYSLGTNASTQTDNTTYEMVVAGQDGLLKLLPVYLDHVLYPLMTDASFVTEVYHVNDDGSDGGVVYSEIQEAETTEMCRIMAATREALFPENSGLRYITGGVLKDIRGLTINRIRDYHKKFYSPKNLMITVVGNVDKTAVLDCIAKFEEEVIVPHQLAEQKKAMATAAPPPTETATTTTAPAAAPAEKHDRSCCNFEETVDTTESDKDRPFSAVIPPLTNHIERDVEFCAADESAGAVQIAWHGCEWKDHKDGLVEDVLLRYLTEGDDAPLTMDLVRTETPLATDVQPNEDYRIKAIILANVDPQQQKRAAEIALATIRREAMEIRLERVEATIQNFASFIKNLMETSPGDAISTNVVKDFVHGRGNVEAFAAHLQTIDRLSELVVQPAKFWQDHLKKLFVDQPHVVVYAKPSPRYADRLAQEQHLRQEDLRAQLGESGLRKRGEVLQEAINTNEKSIPEKILESVKVAPLSSIQFFRMQQARCLPGLKWVNDTMFNTFQSDASLVSDITDASVKPAVGVDLRVPLQFDSVHSQFVNLTAVVDTACLDDKSRLLLPILADALFMLPIDNTVANRKYSSSDAAQMLMNLSPTARASIGFCGSGYSVGTMPQAFVVQLKVEASDYEKAVQHLHDVLFCSVVTKEVVDNVRQSLQGCIVGDLRQPSVVSMTSLVDTLYDGARSNKRAASISQQVKVLEYYQKKPDDLVPHLTALKEKLLLVANMRVNVAGDISCLENPLAPWYAFGPATQTAAATITPIQTSASMLVGKAPGPVDFIPMKDDSGCIMGCGPAPTSFTADDCAAALVAAAAVGIMEGPLWTVLRGQGLVYAFSVDVLVDEGMTLLTLDRTSDPATAYLAAGKVVQSLMANSSWPTETDLQGAKAAAAFKIINSEDSLESACTSSAVNWASGRPQDFRKSLLSRLEAVDRTAVQKALASYIAPAVDPKRALAIAGGLPEAKFDELAAAFAQLLDAKPRRVSAVDMAALAALMEMMGDDEEEGAAAA